jgi:hypothetical protein
MSPTQRSLAFLRGRGYLVAVVEKWNPHARIRQDLFGCLDLVAIKDGETLGVQTTSASNVAARVQKIAEAEATPLLRSAGWKIEVHGWRKLKSGWEPRIVDLS